MPSPGIVVCCLAACAAPMTRAINGGKAAEVTALLDKGYDLNGRGGPTGMTALELAVDRRRPEIAALLLDRGADVNVRRNKTSALSIAAVRGDKEMVRLLLSRGAEVADRDVRWAAGPDRREIVAMLEAAARKTKAAEATAPASTSPASGVDSPAYNVGERPDDLALVVGIGRYMDGPEARFAAEDASAVRRHLIALGWPSRNIILLSEESAGRAGLGKYLERWLPNNVVENSRIFFYFAGDGAVDAAGRAYLLPWDGDAAQLEATGYPLSRLYEKLDALKARTVIAVLDAGFAGAGPRKAASPAARADLAAGKQGDVVAIVASSDAEPAGLLENERHGALTYYLLKGLNGEAADARGSVTLRGLFRYARPEIEHAAGREGRSQTPQLLTGGLGEADLRLR